MTNELHISMGWERLEEGTEEERACFGLLTICYGRCLTEGLDGFVERSRRGPLISGYHLAEWIAWNWWRLVSEPKPVRLNPEWEFAHRLSTIGSGYIWPDITIFSDRQRTVLVAKPTHPEGFAPFRYAADLAVIIPTTQFEGAVESFMGQIQGQLRAEAVPDTNLDRVWSEVRSELADPETTARRRLEALLGFDPDEGDPELLEQLVSDASRLGQDAIQEIAADHKDHTVPTADDFNALVKKYGRDTRPVDMVQLADLGNLLCDNVPAWQHGYTAARMLREQERLSQTPLDNLRLSQLCAITEKALEPSEGTNFAFSIDDESKKTGSVVLRSKWEAGRRFELARLLGDRLTNGLTERLIPATRAYTYRQKLQRAFAAELLCPFEALEDKLDGDYSIDAREDAAHYFNVSERTVTTMLVNHRQLDRDYLEGDIEPLDALAY